MPDTVPVAEVADLIAAIREALNPPEPAFDYSRRQQLVTDRAAFLTGVLAETAAGRPGDMAATARAVRGIDAFYPVRYETAGMGEGK